MIQFQQFAPKKCLSPLSDTSWHFRSYNHQPALFVGDIAAVVMLSHRNCLFQAIVVDAAHCYDDAVVAFHLVDRSCSMQFHSLELCLRHRTISAMAKIELKLLLFAGCFEMVSLRHFYHLLNRLGILLVYHVWQNVNTLMTEIRCFSGSDER